MKIEIVQAMHGDCIWIKWDTPNNNEHNMLIDSGVFGTYSTFLKNKFENSQQLDAVILTHIDDDHIGGFYKYLNHIDSATIRIDNYFINKPDFYQYFNQTNKKSVPHIDSVLNTFIKNNEISKCYPISFNDHNNLSRLDGIETEVFSPNSDDLTRLNADWIKTLNKKTEPSLLKRSIDEINTIPIEMPKLADSEDKVLSDMANDCSIALLLRDNTNSILLLGDSNPDIVATNFKLKGYSVSNKLHADYVKLSHHGSRHSISKELISIIDSNNYIISTNGGFGKSKHPDRETISKIVCSPHRKGNSEITFWFNYPKSDIEFKNGFLCNAEEEKTFNFKCHNIDKGISLE